MLAFATRRRTNLQRRRSCYAVQEGVSLAAVESALRGAKVPRSTTTILVKNLPSTVDEKVLRERFSRFGGLLRVVLAPSRLVGLVEFVDAVSAK